MNYKVKNSNGQYFTNWIGQIPRFDSDITKGKQFSKMGAENLIKLLAEENLGPCEMIQVSDVING